LLGGDGGAGRRRFRGGGRLGTAGYRALTHEALAAQVRVQPAGPQRFSATVRFPQRAASRTFELAGDEIYVDAHILKWKPIANLVGLHTAYELATASPGRYHSLKDEQGRRAPWHSLRHRQSRSISSTCAGATSSSRAFMLGRRVRFGLLRAGDAARRVRRHGLDHRRADPAIVRASRPADPAASTECRSGLTRTMKHLLDTSSGTLSPARRPGSRPADDDARRFARGFSPILGFCRPGAPELRRAEPPVCETGDTSIPTAGPAPPPAAGASRSRRRCSR